MKATVVKRKNPVIGLLNDLIRINYDRVAGYEKAAHESRNSPPHIRDLFYRISVESRAYINELHAKVLSLGGAPVTGTTPAGEIYRSWEEQTEELADADTYALLSACETREDIAIGCYGEVLGEDEAGREKDENYKKRVLLPEPIQLVVERQQGALQSICDTIRNCKDRYAPKK